jgi:hypothetical protein
MLITWILKVSAVVVGCLAVIGLAAVVRVSTEDEQVRLLYIATPLLYVGTGMWMLWRGLLLRAGLVTALISLLPLFWQYFISTDEDPGGPFGYGFGLIVLPMFASSLCWLLIVSVTRWGKVSQ